MSALCQGAAGVRVDAACRAWAPGWRSARSARTSRGPCCCNTPMRLRVPKREVIAMQEKRCGNGRLSSTIRSRLRTSEPVLRLTEFADAMRTKPGHPRGISLERFERTHPLLASKRAGASGRFRVNPYARCATHAPHGGRLGARVAHLCATCRFRTPPVNARHRHAFREPMRGAHRESDGFSEVRIPRCSGHSHARCSVGAMVRRYPVTPGGSGRPLDSGAHRRRRSPPPRRQRPRRRTSGKRSR